VVAEEHAAQVAIVLLHLGQVVAVPPAECSSAPHAVHVSVTASPYLWPAAHAVHVLASLHVSQPVIAEVQVAGAFELR